MKIKIALIMLKKIKILKVKKIYLLNSLIIILTSNKIYFKMKKVQTSLLNNYKNFLNIKLWIYRNYLTFLFKKH
jgi:hypothetical protein